MRPEMLFDLEEFRRRWGKHGHQTCHQFRIKGERHRNKDGSLRDVWCRGFWEYEMPKDQKEFIEACGLVEIVPQKADSDPV